MENWVWYFFAYAFLGWCTEVVFAAIKNGRFINRGFLSGPLCPIYGFGLVGVLAMLTPAQHNIWLLYLGSVIVTTVLELVTGFVMSKLFHQRWWDYSKMPLNIGGYVCLPFSLIWGAACVFIITILHPIISGLVGIIPAPWHVLLLYVFSAVFLLDVVLAVAKAFKLDRRLKQIDELSDALRVLSDKLGETMADGALLIKEADSYARDELHATSQRAYNALLESNPKTVAELRARRDELKDKCARIVDRLSHEHRRTLRAFPHLRSLRNPAALSAVKEKLAQHRNGKGKQQ